jgi:hypothetical protein
VREDLIVERLERQAHSSAMRISSPAIEPFVGPEVELSGRA